MNIMHRCPSVEKDQPQTLPPDSMQALLMEKMNFEAVLEKNLEEATQTMMRNISDMQINNGRNDYSKSDSGRSTSSKGSSSPRSSQSSVSTTTKSKSTKPYQATVEDATSSQDTLVESKASDDSTQELMTPSAEHDKTRSSPPSPSPIPVRPIHARAANSESDIHPVLKSGGRPPRSRESAARVRFSSRPSPKVSHEFHVDGSTTPKQNSSKPRSRSDDKKELELSAVDLKWGKLFTSSGMPTERLSRVYHGLAEYLITEFEPRGSLVLTPEKLGKFYARFSCEYEVLPFQKIFNCVDQTDFSMLTHIYADRKVEFHIIPPRQGEPPCLPALTPVGFVQWMLLFVTIAPDEEAARLAEIVESLPIEANINGDDKPERLPRQLSRYLFPSKPNKARREEVVLSYETMKLRAREQQQIPIIVESAPAPAVPNNKKQSSRTKHDKHDKHDVSRRYVPAQSSDSDTSMALTRPRSSRRSGSYEMSLAQPRRERSPGWLPERIRYRREPSPPSTRTRRDPSPNHRRLRHPETSRTPASRSSVFLSPVDLFTSSRHRETSSSTTQLERPRMRRHHSSGSSRGGDRESEYGYFPRCGDSRRSSIESTPRSSFDSGSTSTRRRSAHGPTHEEWMRDSLRRG